ncbi:stage III sporulation protein AA [Priestia flexa]|uniref:Stage III sporulation protein AA n=1 Tax=Priestia flexa TaxID=86664 RepID=A0ABU4J7U9_9BACI|nr:stage III sporulation protein AA [Priestia flexa]MCG7311909.1 stage III sporulation protein AA [Priestia flexa]MCP1190567.1 stage III sporulation protein AA [Priestia flexa]MDW8517089.1 stage III sporulation protein AA [Priestia flexa]WHX78374.1 stage III sporulation protein AA [Priestia flexa]
MLDEIVAIFPEGIKRNVQSYIQRYIDTLEEVRIRIGRPIELTIDSQPVFLSYVVTAEDTLFILNKLSHFSIYMIEEELKKGYVTIEGGHRVGLAGKVITENGHVRVIRDVTSFNIRVAKEQIGIAEPLIPLLYQSRWLSTILIGPPQTGKTTMIRDLARMMSTGNRQRKIEAVKVGIVDERSEIAGCVKGVPQHTFGTRIDVLDSCPKAEGMMMMIRSMSPNVLIVDEVGSEEDCQAVLEAVNAGVQVFMTVHGYDLFDLNKRPSLKQLIELEVFERYIVLTNENGPGTVKTIYDRGRKPLSLKSNYSLK